MKPRAKRTLAKKKGMRSSAAHHTSPRSARKRDAETATATANLDDVRVRTLRRALLLWAADAGRVFFWREAGIASFHVLVTEILLAKTKAELAEPVAQELIARYPTPARLASAQRTDLARLLYPLGLHRKRAANLIACAKTLVSEHAGEVPSTIRELMQLPYVGRYAANAIACVAFDQQVAVLDANVSRIYGRVFSLPDPPERLATAHDLWELAGRILPKKRAKQFNWAILDLGGTVCTAKNPACARCPIASLCDYHKKASTIRAL